MGKLFFCVGFQCKHRRRYFCLIGGYFLDSLTASGFAPTMSANDSFAKKNRCQQIVGYMRHPMKFVGVFSYYLIGAAMHLQV